jgi:phosphatidylserine/phosphatidylglycerophosphate/cardiolipin synthase-like enzyme
VIGVAMLNLSSTRQVLAAISQAREIDAEAYTLHGPVLRALEEAARDGAHVVVRLEGRPYRDPAGNLAHENRRLVADLRKAGADAQLGHPLHAKAIAVDSTLYLDDKNWGTRDLVLRDDDPSDIASMPSIKHEALAAEAQLLRGARAGDGIVVESESFGCCNPVYSALDALGRAGAMPRLLVCANELRDNDRERNALERLVRDGVRVRVCSDSEKLALAGNRAWCGSANATVAFGESDMPDWGVNTQDDAIVGAVRARLEAQWAKARDFKPDAAAIIAVGSSSWSG